MSAKLGLRWTCYERKNKKQTKQSKAKRQTKMQKKKQKRKFFNSVLEQERIYIVNSDGMESQAQRSRVVITAYHAPPPPNSPT